MPEYLTAQEVATRLRRSVRTIYRWLEEDEVFPHAVIVKGGHLIPVTDVQKLLARSKASPAPAVKVRQAKPASGFVSRWRG